MSSVSAIWLLFCLPAEDGDVVRVRGRPLQQPHRHRSGRRAHVESRLPACASVPRDEAHGLVALVDPAEHRAGAGAVHPIADRLAGCRAQENPRRGERRPRPRRRRAAACVAATRRRRNHEQLDAA